MRAFQFRLSVWSMAACAGIATGCSDYEPASDTLPLSVQLNALGADWSCLQAPREPTRPLGTVGSRVMYGVQMVDLVTQVVVTDVTVRACGLADINCDNPVSADLTADEDGWVDVPMTDNFQGYLEIRTSNSVPYIFHVPDPGVRPLRDFPIVMISLPLYVTLVEALKVTDDPTLGAIAMRTFDCQNHLSAGVVLKSSTGGVSWYFENGLPSTARQQTDPDGLGGFLRSSPGLTLSEATLPDGTRINSQSLIVRPRWMSTGFLRPPQAVAAP